MKKYIILASLFSFILISCENKERLVKIKEELKSGKGKEAKNNSAEERLASQRSENQRQERELESKLALESAEKAEAEARARRVADSLANEGVDNQTYD